MPSSETQEENDPSSLYLGWITEDLFQETILLWSGVYGRHVSNEEALEILTNVKQLAGLSSHFLEKTEIAKPGANPKPDLADKPLPDTMDCVDSGSWRPQQPITGKARRKGMGKR